MAPFSWQLWRSRSQRDRVINRGSLRDQLVPLQELMQRAWTELPQGRRGDFLSWADSKTKRSQFMGPALELHSCDRAAVPWHHLLMKMMFAGVRTAAARARATLQPLLGEVKLARYHHPLHSHLCLCFFPAGQPLKISVPVHSASTQEIF